MIKNYFYFMIWKIVLISLIDDIDSRDFISDYILYNNIEFDET